MKYDYYEGSRSNIFIINYMLYDLFILEITLTVKFRKILLQSSYFIQNRQIFRNIP